jgi:hypothetical protein
MVRIFRITTIYRKKTSDQRLYQSRAMFDKWWAKSIATGPYRDQRIEWVAEEVINGQWVEIDRWNNGKP